MKITIIYKKSDILINKLKSLDYIEIIRYKNIFKRIFLKPKYADVYFHSGSLDKESIKNIKNSKITIVNSFSRKNRVLDKLTINQEKIKVIYPCVDFDKNYSFKTKEDFLKLLDIDIGSKIIFFKAKKLTSEGIIEFLDICSSLNYSNFKIIIAYCKSQTTSLKFLINKYKNIKDKIILLCDYENTNELFFMSDIFLLPTHNKSFSSDVIKAMFYKCVVFVSLKNDSKEIIDVFASMQNPSDASVPFKIDAILNNDIELDNIKEQNYLISKELSLTNALTKFNNLILNMP